MESIEILRIEKDACDDCINEDCAYECMDGVVRSSKSLVAYKEQLELKMKKIQAESGSTNGFVASQNKKSGYVNKSVIRKLN